MTLILIHPCPLKVSVGPRIKRIYLEGSTGREWDPLAGGCPTEVPLAYCQGISRDVLKDQGKGQGLHGLFQSAHYKPAEGHKSHKTKRDHPSGKQSVIESKCHDL